MSSNIKQILSGITKFTNTIFTKHESAELPEEIIEDKPKEKISLLIIDDNQDFADELSKLLGNSIYLKDITETNSNLTGFEIAYDLSSIFKNETFNQNYIFDSSTPIFINIEGKFGSAYRQSQKGIEILLWLRCKYKLPNPVVLYGFQNIQNLLKQKPENYIICSKGCYHSQLPYNFTQINLTAFEPVKDWEGLKKYLKPAFSIDEFRHREANWWGVKCLWDIHKVATKGTFDFNYPEIITRRLEELNNCIADFCFGIGVVRTNDYITKLDTDLNEELEITTNILHDREGKVKIIEDEYKEAINILENEKRTSVIILRKVQKIFRINSPQDIEAAKSLVEETKQKYDNISTEIISIQNKIRKLSHSLVNVYNTAKKEIFQGSKSYLIPNEIKILHIDDQVQNGWSDIIQYIVYNKNDSNNYLAVEFEKSFNSTDKIEEKVESLFNQIKNIIISPSDGGQFYPDVILLDVRLFPNYDELHKYDIEKMSGALLLKKLRKKYLGIPIIVTTASNKVWTYEKLIELGADAYWIKEGIDEQYDINDSKRNYEHFIKLLNITANAHYKFLKEVDFIREKITNLTDPWWQNVLWENGDQTKCDKNSIINLLEIIVIKIKNFLQRFELGIGFNNSQIFSLEARSIMNNVGSIIEALHFSDSKPDSKILQKSYTDKKDGIDLDGRNDYISYIVYHYRNFASHQSGKSCDDFKYIAQPIRLILHLLTSVNHPDILYPDKYIQYDSWEDLSNIYLKLLNVNNIEEDQLWSLK